jgi:hypothetical protein
MVAFGFWVLSIIVQLLYFASLSKWVQMNRGPREICIAFPNLTLTLIAELIM